MPIHPSQAISIHHERFPSQFPRHAGYAQREETQTHSHAVHKKTRSKGPSSSKPTRVCFEAGQTTIEATFKSWLADHLCMYRHQPQQIIAGGHWLIWKPARESPLFQPSNPILLIEEVRWHRGNSEGKSCCLVCKKTTSCCCPSSWMSLGVVGWGYAGKWKYCKWPTPYC